MRSNAMIGSNSFPVKSSECVQPPPNIKGPLLWAFCICGRSKCPLALAPGLEVREPATEPERSCRQTKMPAKAFLSAKEEPAGGLAWLPCVTRVSGGVVHHPSPRSRGSGARGHTRPLTSAGFFIWGRGSHLRGFRKI